DKKLEKTATRVAQVGVQARENGLLNTVLEPVRLFRRGQPAEGQPMSYKFSVRLAPLLRRLLDLQVAHESRDSEKGEELEAVGWPPWGAAEELGSTRKRAPWDYGAELVFAEFQTKGKRFGKEELREHLLLRRLAGLLLHAPLPTDGKTGRE